MLRVQFNNQNSMQQVEFKRISPDVVQLTGKKITKNTSGFKAYRLNGELLGDYSEYTEIVEEVKDGIRFRRSKEFKSQE